MPAVKGGGAAGLGDAELRAAWATPSSQRLRLCWFWSGKNGDMAVVNERGGWGDKDGAAPF